MRATTAGEQTVLTDAAFTLLHRVSVQNGSATWKDLTALGSPAVSYVKSVQIDAADIDQPVAQARIMLRLDEGALSLSPLRTDSTLNRLDDGITYSPLVDAGRRVRIEIAQIAYGTSPVAGDWKNIFEGVIDAVDFEGDPITITARDDGGRLVDWYTATTTTFDYTANPQAIETVIQTILDNQLGAGIVNLYTPTSPAYLIKTFRHDRESLMDALQRLAQSSIGWDLRYAWDPGTSTWRLTLRDPNRSKSSPDATLGAGMYVNARQLGIDRTHVRNRIEVAWGPATSRATVTVDDVSSQNRYGLRRLHIEEATDSAISTSAEANTMASNILSDLKDPKALLAVEMLFYWPVEIFDLIRFSANSKHFDSNQDLAVVGIRHVLSDNPRTFLKVRGVPSGAYRAWFARSLPNPTPNRAAPTASVTLKIRQRKSETVTIDGKLGGADAGPLQWRYNLGGSAGWTAYSSSALPQSLELTRPPYYATALVFEVKQGDGQTAQRNYSIPPYMDDGGTVPREDRSREGYGGVPTNAGSIDPVPKYTGDGASVLIDTALGRLTANIKGPTGTFDGTVMERGAGRGDGGFTSYTGDLVPTAADSRTAPLNLHFRYGTDGPDGVIESGTKGFLHPTYRDASRRPITVYNSTLARDVVANDIDVGQERSRGGFTNATGGLASTAADSRTAPLNQHFRYGTDGAAGVVESATQSFIHQSYIDASRRPVILRDNVLVQDVASNDVNVGQSRARGGFTDATGSLVSTAKDSRTAPLNQHFRYGTDGPAGVIESGTQAFVHPSYTDTSRRPTTLRDTGLAVDLTGTGIRQGWTRSAGAAAQGITAEGRVRAGSGGVDTPAGRINAEGLYDSAGASVLIDTGTKEIKSSLAIGASVRGAADVVFGGTVKYAVNRHNEALTGLNTNVVSFSLDYEQIPEVRVLPLTYLAPTAGNTVEIKAINVDVTGATIRAVQVSGATSTPQTDDFASTLNGTPSASGIALGAPSSEAFCNLTDANSTSTIYKVYFDVNTTSKSGGGLTRVTAYKNDAASSTTWAQVGQNAYDDGVNLTGEHIDFTATLGANYDVRLVVTYSSGTPSVNASVTADRVDYDVITPGTETGLTGVAGAAVAVQAVERS